MLLALAIGLLLGCAVAYFLKVLIDHSPADVNLRRLRLFYLMVISSGGLGGFAVFHRKSKAIMGIGGVALAASIR